MSKKVLITGGYIVPTPGAGNDIAGGDILVVDDKITEIGPSVAAEADEVIDALARS